MTDIQAQILAPLMARVEALETAHAIIADVKRHTDACTGGVGKFIRDRIEDFEKHSAPVDAGSLVCPKCWSGSQVWANNLDPVYRCHRVGCDHAEAVRAKPGDAGPAAGGHLIGPGDSDYGRTPNSYPLNGVFATFTPDWHCQHCDADVPGGQYHDCKNGADQTNADPHRFIRDESAADACQICGHGSGHRDHEGEPQGDEAANQMAIAPTPTSKTTRRRPSTRRLPKGTIMTLNLDQLADAEGKMTEGPWAIANWGYTNEPHMVIEGPEKQKPPTHGDRFWFGGQKAVDWGDDWHPENAAGIVALRNAAKELIAMARGREEMAELLRLARPYLNTGNAFKQDDYEPAICKRIDAVLGKVGA
jgi:hypothetical protein